MFASSMLHASLLLASLLAPSVYADSTAPTAMTPFGERPAANVHHVPTGGQVSIVGDEIHLIDAGGAVIHVAQNDHSKVRTNASEPIESGWIAYASWYNTGPPITSFTTVWDVPNVPATYTGQTLYLFNSIEPASFDAILQPVLQFGPSDAGGGNFWSVASWYLVGPAVYYSDLVEVSPGETLTGIIELTSPNTPGSPFDYYTQFSGIEETLLIATNAEELVWATETLEVYNVEDSSELPTGQTVFRDIVIQTEAGTPSGVVWTPVSDPEDGITTTVNINGAVGAEVTISY